MTALRTDVREQAAFVSTYEKGSKLANQGAVRAMHLSHRADGSVDVDALIEGSTSQYDTYVLIDKSGTKVKSYSCTCPAYRKYAGMCKHAVALALTYEEVTESESKSASGLASAEARTGVAAASTPTPAKSNQAPKAATPFSNTSVVKKKKPPVRTSPAISDFLARHAGQLQLASEGIGSQVVSEAEEEQPKAHLACTISRGADPKSRYEPERGMFSLGLKISRGKASYVVKRIDELVYARKDGILYSYGKNLSFVHTRNAFDDKANALLDLIETVVESQTSAYIAQTSRTYYEVPKLNHKAIPLTADQIIDVLDVLEGDSVVFESQTYNYYYGRQKTKSTLAVKRGTPRLSASIAQDDEGYVVTLSPEDAEVILGEGRMYVIDGPQLVRADERFTNQLGLFLDSVLPARDSLRVNEADMPGFCAAVLPALREFTDLEEACELDAMVPPEPEFTFHIALVDGFIMCDGRVSYGSDMLDLFEYVCEGQPLRDVSREIAAQQTVRAFFPEGYFPTPNYSSPLPAHYTDYDAYRVFGVWPGSTSGKSVASTLGQPDAPFFSQDDDERYYLLFSEGIRALSSIGEVYLSERLRSVTVRTPPSVNVQANVKSGLLDIKVDSLDMTPYELMVYLSSYERKQRYVRMSNGDIVRLDGSVKAVCDLAEGLGVSTKSLVDGGAEMPANRTLFVDAMLKRAGGVRFERNRAFRSIVRDFETVADADISVPGELGRVMRPYQIDGFKWLYTLGKAGFGGVLADDMGLGKTLQAIAYLLAVRDEGQARPALVVCPASLVYNWVAELDKWAPSLERIAVTGAKKERVSRIDAAEEYDVLVTSYDLMKRDIDTYEEQRFSCVILDEAHYIKNATTKSAQSAKRLVADVRFALTGTPIENRLQELWSIFDFLMPGVLGSKESFSKRFANPIAAGDAGAAQRLQSFVGPFILRRLKEDVLADLPEKTESVVYANMTGEQEKLYKSNEAKLALTLEHQLSDEFKTQKLQILAELTKLRQICCDPHLFYENYKGDSAKLETCMEIIGSACDAGHRILLFSQFTTMLDIIKDRLDAAKISSLMLTGSTSKEARVRLVSKFQEGNVPVFLISLKAGGVGLNLTAADMVIHYDPWWNVSAQNQATDRAHRIGQEKNVTVFKLIAKDTIEERIVRMQETKRDLAESVLGGEAAGSVSITRDDILALLDASRE